MVSDEHITNVAFRWTSDNVIQSSVAGFVSLILIPQYKCLAGYIHVSNKISNFNFKFQHESSNSNGVCCADIYNLITSINHIQQRDS